MWATTYYQCLYYVRKRNLYLLKLLLNSLGYLRPNTFLSVIVSLVEYCSHGGKVKQQTGSCYSEHVLNRMGKGGYFLPKKRVCIAQRQSLQESLWMGRNPSLNLIHEYLERSLLQPRHGIWTRTVETGLIEQRECTRGIWEGKIKWAFIIFRLIVAQC